jgi:hypothetical protein
MARLAKVKDHAVPPPDPTQTESTRTSEEKPLQLRCLIKGDTTDFRVSISSDDTIDDLRDCIHETRKTHLLRLFDSADLEVWKVSCELFKPYLFSCIL